MPRIAPISAAQASDEARAAFERMESIYGQQLEPVTVAAHSDAILKGYLDFERAFHGARKLDRRLRDLATLKVASIIGCAFCLDIGSSESLRHGVSAEQVMALHDYGTPASFSDLERRVLDFAVAMTATPDMMTDETFDAVREHLTDEQMVELTAAVAWENYRSRFNHAMGMKSHGFSEGNACALPELRHG